MSADLMGWHDEHSPDHRRRMRNAMLVSLAFHGSIFAAFAITPSRAIMPMPDVIAIELVAAAPAPTRASRPAPPPAPAPETAAPEPPPPEPPPPEPPPPAPPVVKAPVQVLPEESPGRIREAPPEEVAPKIVAKVQPEPKPAPVRPKREKALSYEDAMAALDDEMGVDETADLLQPPPDPAQNQDSSGEPEPSETSQTGAVVSAAVARWNLDTRRKIQNNWVTPSSFRNRGLQTTLEFRLSASGAVIGDPKVVRSSGVPNFDDNAVRAILKAAPLAPPPEPGRQIFIFRAEEN